MTSTQKYFGFSIVPWYNSEEWRKVYLLLMDESESRELYQQAFDIISLWQMRISLLPSGVEGTLCILEGLLANEEALTERNYSIFCSSSIMRFLNICVANRAQVMNFTRCVRQKKIPNWIINIRHDFAHSQKLPKPAMLKLALRESFKWLKENYWKPEFENVKDNIVNCNNPRTPMVVPNYNLSRLISFYGNLMVYIIKDLPLDDYIKEEMDNYEILQCDGNDILCEVMVKMYESATYNKGDCSYIVQDALNTNCFYLNPNSLSDSNLKWFANLLTFLQQNNCICKLISELGSVVYDDLEVHENRQAAVDWLNEIFQAVLQTKMPETKSKWRFNEFTEKDFSELIDLKYSLLKTFNSFTKNLYKSFLELSVAGYSGDSTKFCKDLEKAMSRNFCESIVSKVDDSQDILEQFKDYEQLNDFQKQENLDSISSISNIPETANSTKRWFVVDNPALFETCPIGRLPSEIF